MQTSASLYEFGKFSNFEDTPMNLVILGDSASGAIILCHEEHYLSSKKTEDSQGNKQKQVTKYIVSLIPRVVLVPSISEDAGAVIDYALIRSPAPNILVRLYFSRIQNRAQVLSS